MRIFTNLFSEIEDPENLFRAWEEFRRGKVSKQDVREFELDLERRLFDLARDLRGGGRIGTDRTKPSS